MTTQQHKAAHPGSVWRRCMVLACSLLLLLYASLYYGRIAPLPPGAGVDRALLGALEREHQHSKQALLQLSADRAPLYAAWETQLAILEHAEQVVYDALREDPANLELLKQLRLLQKQQLDLIDKVFLPGRPQ